MLGACKRAYSAVAPVVAQVPAVLASLPSNCCTTLLCGLAPLSIKSSLPTHLHTLPPMPPSPHTDKNPVPFLRPKAGAKFAADLFNAAGATASALLPGGLQLLDCCVRQALGSLPW